MTIFYLTYWCEEPIRQLRSGFIFRSNQISETKWNETELEYLCSPYSRDRPHKFGLKGLWKAAFCEQLTKGQFGEVKSIGYPSYHTILSYRAEEPAGQRHLLPAKRPPDTRVIGGELRSPSRSGLPILGRPRSNLGEQAPGATPVWDSLGLV